MTRITLADTLRQAIHNCGVSQQEVSRRTSVPAPVISRFLSGKRELTLSAADKLVAYLGLELRLALSRPARMTSGKP